MILLILAIVPVLSIGIAFGSVSVPLGFTIRTLLDGLTGALDPDSPMQQIVWNLRLPRTLGAFAVGAGLSIIGVAMQALVRNPLAEPYVLGVSGGASAGASLFYMGLVPTFLASRIDISLAAFLGALLSITIVYGVARGGGRLSVSRLLLAGVALAALMAAVSSFVTFASPDANKTRAVLFWLMGSFHSVQWADLPLAAGVTLAGGLALFTLARPLDALLTGEDPARSLGIRVEVLKKTLIVLSALVTGLLVSISGAIGFVGLIIPHSVRSLVGVGHRWVLPVSFLAGGLFMVLADTLSQLVLPGQQLPVGIVTAVCGVPFFLVLLRRTDYQFK
ncbi:MAG: iron ABC transporter permease [Bacteroidota bacterium]|nr:iron ABC transporter permease [Bacteroidota bacterium]